MLEIKLSGFDSAQLSRIIVRDYKKGSSYTELRDSVVLGANPVYPAGDTVLPAPVDGLEDLEIYFPGIPSTVRIYGVTHDIRTVRRCNSIFSLDKFACISPVSHYEMDGVDYTPADTSKIQIRR